MGESSSKAPAPIALFVYKRPDHTRRLLESLKSNAEVSDTRVFVFADGPRSADDVAAVDATRTAVRGAGLPHLQLLERDRNWGLAANVIDGVTTLCRDFGRTIVLEDDLVLSDTFLRFMNGALDHYAEDPNVLQVAGFMFPVELPASSPVVFLPFIGSWGWATWARAWAHFDPSAAAYDVVVGSPELRRRFDLGGRYYFSEMLRRQVRGESNSWAIRWYLSVFMRGGLAVYPRVSLVQNEGFGADATHCVGDAPSHVAARASSFRVEEFPPAALSSDALERVASFMGRDYSPRTRAANLVRRLFLARRRR